MNCRVKLENFDIHKVLTPKEVEKLSLKKFSKSEVVYSQDTIQILIFKSGRARVVFYEKGESFILHYLQKNNIFVLDENCVVEFMEDSEVYFISSAIVFTLFKNLHFTNIILASMAKSISLEREVIKTLVFNSCKSRIASFFLDMASAVGEQRYDGILIDLTMSINEFANLIASKRQTVSSVLNEMINNGVIKKYKNQKYLIRDLKRLKQYAE